MESEIRSIAPGWRVDDEGRLVRETIHRMTRRLVGWDYRAPSIYQITIVLEDRRSKALGRLVIEDPASRGRNAAASGGGWIEPSAAARLGISPESVEAKIELSPLGEAILEHWKRIGEFTPEIKPLYCRIMPDHLHAILRVTRPMKRPLGQAIAGFKTGCEKIYRRLVSAERNEALAERNGRAGSVSSARADDFPRLFAPGFQDTILFREGQLENMFRYLADNPRRLAIKKLSPELFKTVSSLRVALPGLSRTASGGLGETGPTASGHFAALGNRFLLNRPLAQVQVSRRFFGYKRVPKSGGPSSQGFAAASGFKIARDEKGDPIIEFSSPEFEARRTELFAAAKHGAVLLSPCVSDGERQIAREALSSGYALITMQNKGFSPIEKPSGRYFAACSEGRLLMLAPAAWPYQPGEKPMTRFDATAMNRLCQLIAGEDAAEINYHGMKPANIDALAVAAAEIV